MIACDVAPCMAQEFAMQHQLLVHHLTNSFRCGHQCLSFKRPLQAAVCSFQSA